MKLAILILSCLIANALIAQKSPEKWGSVSKEDLSMSSYEKDSTANAVVLFDYGTLKYNYKSGWRYNFTRHKRVKIFNENAYSEGDVSIYYYSKKGIESIIGIKAHVIKPNGEKIKLPNKNIFDEKINERYNAIKFSLPQLEPGAIIEYRYTLESKHIVELPDWKFQTDIPTVHSQIYFEIPDNLIYVQLSQGRSPEKVVNQNHRMSVFVDGGSRSGGMVNIEAGTIRMWLNDVEAMREEAYTANMEDFYSGVSFQLQATKDFSGVTRPYMSDWKTFSNELINSKSFGEQYKNKRNFSNIAKQMNSLTQGINDPQEKARVIYDFISNSMSTDDRNSIYVTGDQNLNTLFQKKVASKAEINLMLIALLRDAGIDAYPVLLSTRSNGRPIIQYPIFSQFNTLVAVANIGEKSHFLDAGNRNRPMDYLSTSCLNYRGFLLKENASSWIEVTTGKTKEIYQIDITPSLAEETTCNIKAKLEGYVAISERSRLQGEDEEEREDMFTSRLTDRMPDASIEELVFEDEEDNQKPLRFSLTAEVPNAVTVAGDKIYVKPMVYGGITESPFKLEQRLYPVQYPFPWSEQLIINVAIPDGYTPEQLPEQVMLALPNKGGSFRLLTSVNDDAVQIIIKMSIKQLQFASDEYTALREFYNLMVQKAGEVVVFTKKV